MTTNGNKIYFILMCWWAFLCAPPSPLASSEFLEELSEFDDLDRKVGIDDYKRTLELFYECQNNINYLENLDFKVECHTNYHHYNSGAKKYYDKDNTRRWIEIGSFNLWHPGSNTSPFKDYEFVANVMNKFDVVAAQELLPFVGSDQENNDRVLKYHEELLEEQRQLQGQLPQRLAPAANSYGDNRNIDYGEEFRSKVAELNALKVRSKKVKELYRMPGYLQILDALRKKDPSWSLILAPSGEAADDGNVKELVGFYYRAKTVIPKINEHCEKFKKSKHGTPYACYPKLTKAWSGKNLRSVFSRRPFIGSFEAGSFDFTLVTSHVVFRAPPDQDAMTRVLKPVFGIDDYNALGTGATKANFARIAEMKAITEIMGQMRRESKEKDIIFLGDTNLEAKNEQWENILNSFPGGKLYIDRPTTLSMPRILSDGTTTNGVASDYDHFILDPSESQECIKKNGKLSPRIASFYSGKTQKYVQGRYYYRRPGTLDIMRGGEVKRANLVTEYRSNLEKIKTIKRNKIVPDDSEIDEMVFDFDERVFLSQVNNRTFYKVYREVLSDHFPVYISCQTRN